MIFRSGLLSAPGNITARDNFTQLMMSFIPSRYNWTLFVTGEVLIILSLGLILKRTLKK